MNIIKEEWKIKYFIYKKKKEIENFKKQLKMMGWILNERSAITDEGEVGKLAYICRCEPSPMFNRNGKNDLSVYKGFRINKQEKAKTYMGCTRDNIEKLFKDVEKAEKLIKRFEEIKTKNYKRPRIEL